MKKILLIEDNPQIRENTAEILELAGYQVLTAKNGKEGVELAVHNKPDLVICDIMMPVLDGYGTLHMLNKNPDTAAIPFIFLTAKAERSDFRKGMEMGADDYVTKPYSSRELIARIKAVLRRGLTDDGSIQDQDLMEVGPVELNIGKHQVSVNGSPVSLPLTEFELLEFLMRNSSRVLTRSQLIDRLWGGDYYGDTKTLDVHIKRLRAKIEADPANPVLIQTIRGLGYKLENL